MPWVRAELRGQRVYARADARGELVVEGGRVEVRYRRDDGKLYRAAARNLAVVDGKALPDDTCGDAAPVAKPQAKAKRSPKRGRPPAAGQASSEPVEPGTIVVYTDGACSSNPGPAGLGVVILRGNERLEISEFLGHGTNNIAELTAVLRALENLPVDAPALIHTDSKYTIGVVVQGWKAKRNASLVAALRGEIAKHPRVRLTYVPGHVGVELNERADQLARRAVDEQRSSTSVVPEEGRGSATP